MIRLQEKENVKSSHDVHGLVCMETPVKATRMYNVDKFGCTTETKVCTKITWENLTQAILGTQIP